MDLSPVTADITVTSERPTVDVTQTNTQQNFSADYLRKIPVGGAGRDYLNIIAQAPASAPPAERAGRAQATRTFSAAMRSRTTGWSTESIRPTRSPTRSRST